MKTSVSSDQLVLAAEQNVKEGEYWMTRFSGEWTRGSFPYDMEPTSSTPSAMALEPVIIPEKLLEKLMDLSKKSDVKLHMILTTGVFILLNKYSGQNDIVIGSPILKQEVDSTFINTILPFREKIIETDNFKELLLRVRDTIIKANENQNYPMEIVIKRLNLSRNRGGYPLFDVAVILENLHRKDYLDGIDYNFLFSFNRNEDKIDGFVEYNTLYFEAETIHRIIKHFLHVMDTALIDVNRQISSIDLITPEEREKVFTEFNSASPGISISEFDTLHRLFEKQVAETPDKVALFGVANEVQCTYRELNLRANRLARKLNSMGVGPDSIVAIMVEASIEMIIGLIGILKAGGAYLPIAPGYPGERIEFMIKDSATSVLITMQYLQDKTDVSIPTIFMEDVVNSGSILSEDEFYESQMEIKAENLAYVIYTSGTTGKPKGVLVEHRQVVSYMGTFYNVFEWGPDTAVIQLASFTFDVFVEEVFPILLRGGKVVIPDAAQILDIDSLSRRIAMHRINVIDCTPLLLKEFNRYQTEPDTASLNRFSSIHTFISGGDVLKRDYIDKLLDVGNVYNTYGPTESTVCATYYPCPKTGGNFIPIGKPISNYSVYILDRRLNLAPIGINGEICISGVGITRGYLNRPELTHEKYIPDPFQQGLRIYRTGDLGRWLSDGTIEFTGRIDHQVKIRGFRIELGEIERHLLTHEKIKDVVVIDRSFLGSANEKASEERFLCAFIVSEKEIPFAELKEFLAKKVPDYMIPAFFINIETIPVTSNGKVDRQGLQKVEISRSQSMSIYEPPKTFMEKNIASIWSELLKIDRVSVHDNFFNLGGNSMTLIELANKIKRRLGKEIPVVKLFQLTTIRDIAGYFGIEDENADRQLVLLNPGNKEMTPLFLIHDGSGEVDGYVDFCRYIDCDIPIWGIRFEELQNGSPFNRSIEEIAASYIEKIKTICPSGFSYRIAGWSIGGTIAFEIVRQLEMANEKVTFLGLIDTYASDLELADATVPFTNETEWNLISRIPDDGLITKVESFKHSIEKLWGETIEYLEKIENGNQKVVQLFSENFLRRIPTAKQNSAEEFVRYINLLRTLDNSRNKYIPLGKIGTQVHFFKAAKSVELKIEKWAPHCEQQIKVFEIPGDHYSIFKTPIVESFAGIFKDNLLNV